MKIFGERLRTLRLKYGMTQQALADKLCTERTTITGWELKGKEPDFDFVVDIADVFDVSIDYLFGRDAFLEKFQEMSNSNDADDTSPYESD